MIAFVLVNECTDANLTPPVLGLIASAVLGQLNGEVAAEWGGGYAVRVASDTSDVIGDECAIWIKDTLPDVPGAEGYHATLANGAPVEYVARDTVEELTTGANCLSVVISHECCEVAGNRGANLFAVKSDGKTEQARELCDRVQDTAYPAPNGVMLANFLYQAAFIPGSDAPWDHLRVLTHAEDRTPGGYEIDAIFSEEKSVFGRKIVMLGAAKHIGRAFRLGHRR